MPRNKSNKKLPVKLKALSISLAVFLALAIFIVVDFRALFPKNSTVSPPQRNIVHSDDPGKITEFNLSIEKLGINVPVIPNVDGKDKQLYDQALNNGVAHYKNTALPNSGSNIVIFGHSSTVLGIGKYAKIFATLDKLSNGDEIKIDFNRKEYKYSVSEKKIVAADDLSPLMPTQREQLTLLTCWPVGTAEERLAIFAKPEK